MWNNKPVRTARICPQCGATTDRPHSQSTCIQYLRAKCRNDEKRADAAETRCKEWERIADLIVAFRLEAEISLPEKPAAEILDNEDG